MSESPLDNPLINRRAQKKFGLSAPELLEAYEADQLLDRKAIKMAQRISEELDAQDRREERDFDVNATERDPEARNLAPWLLWLIPLAVVLVVLAANGWELPF